MSMVGIYYRSHRLFDPYRTSSFITRQSLTDQWSNMKRDRVMSSETGSMLLTGKPHRSVEAEEGSRKTVAKGPMHRPAVHQLLCFPLYKVRHPEDALLPFTCPVFCYFRELVLLWDPMLKLLHWFLFWGGPYRAGYCNIATKITQ